MAIVLDHIGISVCSIEERAVFYQDLLGLPVQSDEVLPHMGVRLRVYGLGKTRIELIEPLGKDSPVRKSIALEPIARSSQFFGRFGDGTGRALAHHGTKCTYGTLRGGEAPIYSIGTEGIGPPRRRWSNVTSQSGSSDTLGRRKAPITEI